MTQFKILKSRRYLDDPNVAEFDLQYLQSRLQVGDRFTVYETHHAIQCEVLRILAVDKPVVVIRVDWKVPWDDWLQGAIVDTEAISRPTSFHY